MIETFCSSAAPQPGVVQLLEGFSEGLLDTLKDILVERDRLTLGKELGKGQSLHGCLVPNSYLI